MTWRWRPRVGPFVGAMWGLGAVIGVLSRNYYIAVIYVPVGILNAAVFWNKPWPSRP